MNLHTKSNRAVLILAACFAFENVSLAQADSNVVDPKGNEDFMSIKEGIMKKEIASFNSSSELTNPVDSSYKKNVDEIPLVNCTDSSATFSKGGIVVKIIAAKFDATQHKLSYDSSEQVPFLKLIDNAQFWGTDGGVPRERIKSVTFIRGKYKMSLPISALDRLYEPNFCTRAKRNGEIMYVYSKVFQSKDKKRVYIYMMNSDGAGGYEVTWVIKDDKYYTRVVDYGF